MYTISEIKNKAEQYISDALQAVSNETHVVLRQFTLWMESEAQAEADAVALLQSRGYGVVPPSR